MKRRILAIGLPILVLATGFTAKAGVGDTTRVHAFTNVLYDWAKYVEDTVQFPVAGKTYHRIILEYKIGCPASGCSPWDYTTRFGIMKKNGKTDSSLVQYPKFTVDSTRKDSVAYSHSQTYKYFYNSTSHTTDSTASTALKIQLYGDSINPQLQTGQLTVYPAHYYNFIFDSNGHKTDSVYVKADTVRHLSYYNRYKHFPGRDRIELGRVITPYAQGFSKTWYKNWYFDVTDYAPLLHDSVNVWCEFDGYSNGFLFSATLDMIEGTPPRTPIDVYGVYDGAFGYGNPANAIELHLPATDVLMPANAASAQLNMIVTGHGNDDTGCSEFCSKYYQVKVNNNLVDTRNIWRDDCGMNSLYPQPGTWWYDRGNWCPGEKGLTHYIDVSNGLSPGNNTNVNVDFEPYTSTTNNGGSSPVYIVNGHVIAYGPVNHNTDATITQIIAPNTDANYTRYNPVCSNPMIVIRNNGSQTLNSLDINYGVMGGSNQTYHWMGSLGFLKTDTVYLGALAFDAPSGSQLYFQAVTSMPNGNTDENTVNDTLRSKYVKPVLQDSKFVIVYETNTVPTDNSYKLWNVQGQVVKQSRANQAASTIYKDTVDLPTGCYFFEFYDASKDGLATGFPQIDNVVGVGYVRFQKLPLGTFKTFNPNFGTRLNYSFTVVSNTTNVSELDNTNNINVFPNPSNGKINLGLSLALPQDVYITVTDILGRQVYNEKLLNADFMIHPLDLSKESPGMYMVTIRTQQQTVIKKITLTGNNE